MRTVPVPAWTITTRERFLASKTVDASSGCWLWRLSTDRKGYGQFSIGLGKYAAHRVAYSWLVGPIPEGLTIDHLCRNHGCVNPAHLEAVTQAENVRRGDLGRRKTHCVNGHPLSGANVRLSSGRRTCRTCELARGRAAKARLRLRGSEDRPMTETAATTDPVVQRLREVREAEGWTQADVAALVGVSRAQIANVEAGKADMPLRRVRRWCDVLGLRLEADIRLRLGVPPVTE